MQLNLVPIGLPDVEPTPFQMFLGHALVGLSVAGAVHFAAKTHPAVSLGIATLAVVIHAEFDAPASQVVAGVAAKAA